MFQFFHQNRKAIVSTNEGLVVPCSDQGWDICMNAAIKAGAELRELKRRTRGGVRRIRAKGKLANPSAAFGYLYITKYERDADGRSQCLIEDPVDSSIPGLTKRQVVVDVFRWRTEQHMRISAICDRLNRSGILSAGKKGLYEPGLWSRTAVAQMLRNSVYAGERREGDTMIECPAFVSRETWQAAQDMFAESKRMWNGRPTTKSLLTGFLRCKYCGHRSRTVGRERYKNYCCGNYNYKLKVQRCRENKQMSTKKADGLVWTVLWKHLTNAELLLQNARAYYDSLPSKSGTAKKERELTIVTSRMERTRRMVRLGTEDEDTGNALILADKQRIEEIQAELRAASSVMSLPPAHMVQAACDRIAASGAKLETFSERRPVLEALVDLGITFAKGELEITGKLPVPEVAAASMGRKCYDRLAGLPS
jgi:hypothetical protein